MHIIPFADLIHSFESTLLYASRRRRLGFVMTDDRDRSSLISCDILLDDDHTQRERSCCILVVASEAIILVCTVCTLTNKVTFTRYSSH
jgi:hypothetical protein